ncbi:E3 ubiquitin-protein ligase TRIM9-like [Liolophura sinensis]|uniref:E3 ubiquitin-protein ligase TRIM9-like n=1 Tax=Liolophura sinensis TaxID=3198878 RepID=UPI0031593521
MRTSCLVLFVRRTIKGKLSSFAPTVVFLYCKDCQASLHPMRGELKRHRLISAQEYMTQRSTSGEISREEQASPEPLCARHSQPFCMYCVPCQTVICTGCVVEHPEHGTRDLASAAEKKKPTVLNKAGQLEKVLQETKESLSRFVTLHSEIQENRNLHCQEVEKAYRAALEALEAWKQRSLDQIEARYSQWSVESSATIKTLGIQTEEIERMVQASKNLLSSMDVKFLEVSQMCRFPNIGPFAGK